MLASSSGVGNDRPLAQLDRVIGEIERFDQHVVGHARIAPHHLREDLVCPLVVSSGNIVFLAFAD
jgi:hypothetical protein